MVINMYYALCAGSCSKTPKYFNSFSYFPRPVYEESTIVVLIYNGLGNGATEILNHLPKDTELTTGRAGILNW